MALNFYDENEGRSYPFVERELNVSHWSGGVFVASREMPDTVVVDFGAITGIDVNYAAAHTTYLFQLRRTGSSITFEFRSTCPDLAGLALVFTRDSTDDYYAYEEVEAVESFAETSVSISQSFGAATSGRWRAYLVTGHLDELFDQLADGDVWTAQPSVIETEPSLTQRLYRHFVRSLNLANESRTYALPYPGCSNSSPTGASELIVNARGIVGDPKFKEGYNCTILVNDLDNSITIGAEVGAGAGEPCEEPALYEDEEAQAGSPFLGGGAGCGELISTINGVMGPYIQFFVESGIRFRVAEDDPSRLIMTVDLHDLTVCASLFAAAESSSSSAE